MDLAEFLLAVIAKDEAAARDVWNRPHLGSCNTQGDLSSRRDDCDCGYPARVLAECEAKRRIVEVLDMTPCPCQSADRCVIHDVSAASREFALERYVDPVTETTLRALALPYADHPEFRPEWAATVAV